MKRRDFIQRGVLGTVGAMTAGSLALPAVAPAAPAVVGGAGDRPNILYIIVHDLGTALGCYGTADVKSPRLDQLASEGLRFAQYYCCSTPCSPSRGCIVTGRYAHSTGLIGLANRNWSLPMTERTVVDHMNDAGYYTVNFGGQHERVRVPESYNYKQTGDPQRRKCDQVADDVTAFLKTYDPKNGPFYINAFSQDVHAPWDRPEFQGKYNPDEIHTPVFLPNIKRIREGLSKFCGSVSFMDQAVGRILDTLRETGLAGKTLVIFTTDHGVSFPRAKSTLYDPGLTTALLMRWPGRIKPGTVCNHLLGNVDFLPSLLELIGRPIPKEIQGRSFAPAILGGSYTPNEQIFAERNFHNDYDPMRCVRTTRHKLIRNIEVRDHYKIPSEATDADTSLTLRNSGKPRPFEELYDLEKDPHEWASVADDPAYAPVLKDLRARLDKWMTDTADYTRGAKGFVYTPGNEAREALFEGMAAAPAPGAGAGKAKRPPRKKTQ